MDIRNKSGVGRPSKNKKTKVTEKRIVSRIEPKTLLEKVDVVEKVVVSHAKVHFFDRFKNLRAVQKPVMIWLILIGGLLLSVGIFRIFAPAAYREADFSDGGLYSEGFVGQIESLNPLFASSSPEKAFSKLAFSRLYDIDSSGKLNTDLATKTDFSEDLKKFTTEIRKNATWSDGEKITANDVIFTISLLQDKTVNPAKYQSWKNIVASKKDDFSVEFSVPYSSKLVLHTLDFPILPEHKLKDVQREKIRENIFSQNPVTSGEFNFKTIKVAEKKTTISLEKNLKYYKGSPKLDYFEISSYENRDDLISALKTGEISASPDVELADFAETDRAKIEERRAPINRGIYAFLNNSSAIFKDKNVRLAVQSGVDISKIRKEISPSNSSNLPILSELIESNDVEISPLDVEKAKKILEDSGWKLDGKVRKKDGANLKVNIATVGEKNLEISAKNLKNQLENLGFEVDLTIADKDDKSGNFVRSTVQTRNYDILVYEIDFGSDYDIYAFWHSSQGNDGLNFSKYSDAISDDILINYRKSKTDDERKKQLTLFLKRWLAQAPAIEIARSELTYVHRKSVKTFSNEISLVEPLDRYNDVLYWQVNKSELYKTP